MEIRSLIRATVLTAAVASALVGCGGPAGPTGGRRAEEVSPPADSWVYHSKEYGFSLRLPSRDWKQAKKKSHLVDFYSIQLGSPMLACVSWVKKQTPEQFRKSVTELKTTMSKGDVLRKPSPDEGKTESGNPYCYIVACEKGQGEETFYYVATSLTRLEGKGLTVCVLFEGQGRMQSRLFKSLEYSRFEKAARDICLSVE